MGDFNVVSHETDRSSRKRLLGQIGNVPAPDPITPGYSVFKIEVDDREQIFTVVDEDFVTGMRLRSQTILYVDLTNGSADGKLEWIRRNRGDASVWVLSPGEGRDVILTVDDQPVTIRSRRDYENAWFYHFKRSFGLAGIIQTAVIVGSPDRP